MADLDQIKKMLEEDDDLELSQNSQIEGEDEVIGDEEEVREEISEEMNQPSTPVYKLFNPVTKSIFIKSENIFKFSLNQKEMQMKCEEGICFKCSCLDHIIIIQQQNQSILQICNDCLSKFI